MRRLLVSSLGLGLLSACAGTGGVPVSGVAAAVQSSVSPVVGPAVPDTSLQQASDAYSQYIKESHNGPLLLTATQRLAELAIEQGQSMSEAIGVIETLLRSAPEGAANDQLLYLLAEACERTGQPVKQLDALTRLVEEYPGSPRWREAQFRRAELLFSQQHYALASKAYSRITAGGANLAFYPQALYKLGWSHYKLGNMDAARQAFYALFDALHLTGDINALAIPEQGLARDALRAVSLSYRETQDASLVARDLAGQASKMPYSTQIYTALSQLYVQQHRPVDAAVMLAAFARELPSHPQAPWSLVRAAQLYDDAGMAAKAMADRVELLRRYPVSSDFWRAQDPQQVQQYIQILPQLILQIARYHHGLGQQLKSPQNLTLAARWYHTLLSDFPKAEQVGEAYFLLGEVRYEMGDYSAAVSAYENAAYVVPAHKNSAEAGYAALLSWQKRVDISGEVRSASYLDSMDRFIRHFPQDARWPTLMQARSEAQFAAQDYPGALAIARTLHRTLTGLGKEVDLSLLVLIAQSELELGQFSAAEQTAQDGLKRSPAVEQKQALLARLAMALYRQGEIAQKAQRWREAGEFFSRVPPEVDLYVSAQYYAGEAFFSAHERQKAIALLEGFTVRYPDHAFVLNAREKLAELYEAQGQWRAAADQLELLASGSGHGAQQLDLLSRAARNYTRAGLAREAASVHERITVWFSKPLDAILQARSHLATWYQSQGQPEQQREQLLAIVNKRPYVETDASLRPFIVHAAMTLAETDEQACQQIALNEPLQAALKQKKVLLQSAIYYYALVVEMSPEKYATSATHRMGALYQDFAQSLLKSGRPRGLASDELEMYQVMLEEQAFPFEEKAIALFEKNLRAPTGQENDPWVSKSRLALGQLRPATHAEAE